MLKTDVSQNCEFWPTGFDLNCYSYPCINFPFLSDTHRHTGREPNATTHFTQMRENAFNFLLIINLIYNSHAHIHFLNYVSRVFFIHFNVVEFILESGSRSKFSISGIFKMNRFAFYFLQSTPNR